MGFVFQVLSYTRRHNETVNTITRKLNSGFANSYNFLFVRKAVYPEPEGYSYFRKLYAWFIVSLYVRGNREGLRCHLSQMKRMLTAGDYLSGIAQYNPVSRFLSRWK
jgi:hypothetical protein